MPYMAFGLITLLLWVFCLVDVLTRQDWEVRNIPRIGWILIVLLVPTIGSILWLVFGRPEGPVRPPNQRPHPSTFGEYERPGRHIAQNPDDDEAFLRQCRERAEEQRRIARQQRLAREAGDE
ncbi:PLD nuclease N-terminal domain-containing protein [Rhodococcus sp. NPDC127528]|uniref:PLD nuclease N-terminal domain-containing protein n=1 Tax=unclassified Rhodococcus (in: high G+C Gram-positive bacteria) TaxID=192944 RepID=UPI00364280AB